MDPELDRYRMPPDYGAPVSLEGEQLARMRASRDFWQAMTFWAVMVLILVTLTLLGLNPDFVPE